MFFTDKYKKLGKKALDFTVQGITEGAKLGAKAAKQGSKYAYEHREQIGGTVEGIGKGAVEAAKGLYGHTISESDLKKYIEKLKEQSSEYARLNKIYCQKAARFKTQKQILADSLFMSTAFLANYFNTGTIPAEITQAYELAYPDLAAEQSLSSVIESTTPEQAAGFINGIKGKLFEIKYVDYLNNGHLPPEHTAQLAESAINPGWDIQIVDAFGNTAETLQLKATESAAYVQDALARYPHIDVVTTEEVYNQLVLNGMADYVINSGISNDELTSIVTQSLDRADFEMDFVPSVIPFLIIGYSVSRKSWLNNYQKGKEFGARSFSSWIAYITGGAITGLTGFWVAGLGAVLLTNYGLETGRRRLKRYYDLQKTVDSNDKILRRLQYKISMI